ncbi:dihydrolipoyl dehydrogenase family protein [Fusibacter sp. JL216-2]|uniref:dihydrolipoyl dehydrogenase family protein n=1 Tax=Fusibacter sp. JL216-2 TaxID=3071453 RepID=UPI003D3551F3
MKFDYDILIIGGGSAGITSAMTAIGFGKRVAIIEKNKLGGDCTWSGCIPSKALVKRAKLANEMYKATDLGFGMCQLPENIGIMDNVRDVIHGVYAHETPEVMKAKGIDVIEGQAKFMDRNTVDVGGKPVTADKFIICTGSIPFVPPIPGLDKVAYRTNENLFEMPELPGSMVVIGGGPIGMEMAQAMQRLGVKVTVILRREIILERDNHELGKLLMKRLHKEGIRFRANTEILRVDPGKITIKHYDESEEVVDFDEILIATGRKTNLNSLGLEKIGVAYTDRGLVVDEHLETTQKGIYGAGDSVGPYRLSHIAENHAIISVVNASLPVKRKVNYDNVPWVTFTDPEMAHMGMSEAEARDLLGSDLRIYKQDYSELDRAITERETLGRAIVYCDKKGMVYGADILGNRAGELIHELLMFKFYGISLNKAADMIYAYPTYSEIIRKLGKKAYISDLERNPLVKVASMFMGRGRKKT